MLCVDGTPAWVWVGEDHAQYDQALDDAAAAAGGKAGSDLFGCGT